LEWRGKEVLKQVGKSYLLNECIFPPLGWDLGVWGILDVSRDP